MTAGTRRPHSGSRSEPLNVAHGAGHPLGSFELPWWVAALLEATLNRLIAKEIQQGR
jgi:hypothetical protein